MAAIKCCAVGLVTVAVAALAGGSRAAGPVELREGGRSGSGLSETTRVRVELKASGLYLPAATPGAGAGAGASKAEVPKPLAMRVEAKLEFLDRVVKRDARGRPGRALRRVLRAGSAVNGEIRPMSTAVRREVAILVAEPRAEGVAVFSPSAPLTRPELELLQGPGDPLAFDGLLPGKAVAVGDRWPVGESAAKSISAYDTLSLNKLEATLESVDDESARVRLRGEIRGAVLGGEGTMACDGSYTFDRKAARIDRLTVNRAETRRPGLVEEGLDLKGTLTVTRQPAETPAELTDAAAAKLSLSTVPGAVPERERLLLKAPAGRYTLVHDRDWHTYWDDPRLTVLKRVEGGRLIAQCNLATGPNAGKGRHQDPSQFRDDVRKGLGERFVQFLGAGELDGSADGAFRYKLGVQGRQGDLGVVWYYYLIASPDGEQLLATFTMAEAQVKAFGDQDEVLIGSLRWMDKARDN
jgi:hypothetical protein